MATTITAPTMLEPYAVLPDIDALPSVFPIPGLGLLTVNAFLFRGSEPLLVDAGLVPTSAGFMDALAERINPADLAWIWLSHTDQDHVGSLAALLEAAPKARVITTFLGLGKMSLWAPLPLDRIFLLNPGEELSIGGRRLTARRPPIYDAPETTCFFDRHTGVLFTSDSFGAVLSEPAPRARDISADALSKGGVLWATVDSPWLHRIEQDFLEGALQELQALQPTWVLSSHLPAADGAMFDTLLGNLRAAREAAVFMGPNQAELEALLASTPAPERPELATELPIQPGA